MIAVHLFRSSICWLKSFLRVCLLLRESFRPGYELGTIESRWANLGKFITVHAVLLTTEPGPTHLMNYVANHFSRYSRHVDRLQVSVRRIRVRRVDRRWNVTGCTTFAAPPLGHTSTWCQIAQRDCAVAVATRQSPQPRARLC